MLYNILPEWLNTELEKNYIAEQIYEIRIRTGKPIVINYRGKYITLKENELFGNCFIIADASLIRYVIDVATKQSLYAFNDQIKRCYITTDSGFRIGICGEVVTNNGKISTIKNITSLNIRISHDVVNCSQKIIKFICQGDIVKNTLIISPPGAGKTTLIRDIANKLSNEKMINNILVVDERYEIAGGYSNNNLTTGMFVDVISGTTKSFAFNECLKSMSPTVIITDEISAEEDVLSLKQAIKSGVKVIATAHAENVNDLKFKNYFKDILTNRFFERIIVLSKRNGVGTVEGVYDENLQGLYIPFLI